MRVATSGQSQERFEVAAKKQRNEEFVDVYGKSNKIETLVLEKGRGVGDEVGNEEERKQGSRF